MGLFPADIDKGSSSVKFLKISVSGREEASFTLANAYEVSLFRKINNIPTSGNPTVRVLLSPSNTLLELDYNYSALNPAPSPYPVISNQEAWQTFQDNKAYVSTAKKFSSVTVDKIYLSYWESDLPQVYLQPVLVFVGSGKINDKAEKFTAFLPAVSPSYLISDSE